MGARIEALRALAGEALIRWGFRLLGVKRDELLNKLNEEAQDEDSADTGYQPQPPVQLSPEAAAMRFQQDMKPKVEKEPPLKGSLQDRMNKARGIGN